MGTNVQLYFCNKDIQLRRDIVSTDKSESVFSIGMEVARQI